jgi:uncharacterized protein YjiS (DUF1127 family)
VVMEEFRVSLLDRRGDQRRSAARWDGATATVRALDRTAQREWPLWALLDVPLTARAPRRAEMADFMPLRAILRLVAAIRLWRARARSRQELRELSDHLLKDIGLRRQDVGYESRKMF